MHFYPRSPCGERPEIRAPGCAHTCISIHALLAESDVFTLQNFIDPLKFLSTLSLRRATRPIEVPQYHILISIHALLAESDIAGLITSNGTKISIHALLAESDLDLTFHERRCIIFLSTLSLRRATGTTDTDYCDGCISIHALLAESDSSAGYILTRTKSFLSTLSLRRATGSLRA